MNDEPLQEKDYERAQEIWSHFDIRTLQQYHDPNLKSDVLLLADVTENFRKKTIYSEHGLDCLHFITLPSLAWACALKYTEAELELITDPHKYLMVENSLRGGIATISRRHVVASIPLVERYDPAKPHSWIQYLDARNL